MMRLLFDLETNGLFYGKNARPDFKILCGVAINIDSGKSYVYPREKLEDMLPLLSDADLLVGHNIAGFDIPALDLVYPGWRDPKLGQWYDTKLVSQQVWPQKTMISESAIFRNTIGGRSPKKREEAYPQRLLAPLLAHSLEAWGYRLHCRKGNFLKDMGVQEHDSEELRAYCEQDCRVNVKLFERLTERGMRRGEPPMPMEAAICETQFGWLATMGTITGVGFDSREARNLYATLSQKRDELDRALREQFFPNFFIGSAVSDHTPEMDQYVEQIEREGLTPAGYKVPKRSYKVKYPHRYAGRQEGCPYTPITLEEFSVASHAADRLQKVYKWVPKEFTEKTGKPMVNDKILSDLDYPAVPLMREALVVKKRLGQLGEGPKSFIASAVGDKIHGRIHPSGTRTSRCTHTDPNLAQVVSEGKAYGLEFRDLFSPTDPRHVMVGTDASGIELRMLGSRMAFYDGGDLARTIVHGDVHSDWQKITGLFYRSTQKNVTYSYIYGGGNKVIGMYLLMDWRKAYEEGLTDKAPPGNDQAEELGKIVKEKLAREVVGLEQFVASCHATHRRGWLRGVDGRIIRVKSEHGSVNDVLQSDAGIAMKYAAVIRWDMLVDAGFEYGKDFNMHLNIHDEWQDGVVPEKAEEFGKISVQAIRHAGTLLNLRVELDGEFKIGKTWKETH